MSEYRKLSDATISVVNDIFKDCGVLMDGHFVYASGRHGEFYVNKDALYVHPENVSKLCRIISLLTTTLEFDVVASPAIGGVALTQWTAFHRSRPAELLEAERFDLPKTASRFTTASSVYCEKAETGGMEFRRGYDKVVAESDGVLVVEDILTTGGSALATVKAVEALGGRVMGIAALCNRGGVTGEDLGVAPDVPLYYLKSLNLKTWAPEECPLCANGVEVNTNVGKGRQFLADLGKAK